MHKHQRYRELVHISTKLENELVMYTLAVCTCDKAVNSDSPVWSIGWFCTQASIRSFWNHEQTFILNI